MLPSLLVAWLTYWTGIAAGITTSSKVRLFEPRYDIFEFIAANMLAPIEAAATLSGSAERCA